MTSHARFGARGPQLTVARVDWTYSAEPGLYWATPAPTSVLGAGPRSDDVAVDLADGAHTVRRNHDAEVDALDDLLTTRLRPLQAEALQWRAPELAREAHAPGEPLWTLLQEEHFGDLWSEHLPRLQAKGWHIVVRPGFAHQTTPVTAWKLAVDRCSLTSPSPVLARLAQPWGQGSWRVSLGIEVDGQTLDAAPLIADLIQRDKRWLHAADMAAIDDRATIVLKVPGGQRVQTPAAPIKAVVAAMLDLLTDARRQGGPWLLSEWDAARMEALRENLSTSQRQCAAAAGQWAFQCHAGLVALAARLKAAGTPSSCPEPAGLGIALRTYQRQGVAWLQYLREHQLAGILADDMGLGKTAQALAHLLIEKQAGRLDIPALIVMPTSLVFNWLAEAARIAPDLCVIALQGPGRHAEMARMSGADVVLTTYPLLWRDIEALAAQPFHTVILDEAQTVKNAASKGAAAVRRLQTRHRVCLTGTPLENHLGELWAQFDFLMPGFLGDQRTFQRLWRDPIEKNGETLRAQLLARRLRPFILRRRKVDVAHELPPKTEAVQLLRLEGRQKALYESVRVAADEMVRRALRRQGFEGAHIAVLDALLKLRQVCCDPWLLQGRAMPRGMERAKLEWLRDMLPALIEDGRRVLVFSQFTQMLDLIAEALDASAVPYVTLTGDTAPARRGEVVGQFQRQEVPLMLISLKAGGLGLNLTAADTVVHTDPWWNPAAAQQAEDRAHRMGQEQPVTVYKLLIAGSIEERIQALQARKSALAEGVLGHDTVRSPKFTEADLQALLAPLS